MRILSLAIGSVFLFQPLAFATGNDCAERAQLVTEIDQQSLDIMNLYRRGMDQVATDMERKDLICAKDHVNLAAKQMTKYINWQAKVLKLAQVDYCDAYHFPETIRTVQESILIVTGYLSSLENAAVELKAATEQIDPLNIKKCSVDI